MLREIVSWLTALFFLCVGGTMFYWLVIDTKAPVRVTGPTRILNAMGQPQEHFHVGDTIIVEQTYCRDYLPKNPGTIRVTWEDSVIYTQPPVWSRRDLGCGTRRYLAAVPPIPASSYMFKVQGVWTLNPLTTVTVDFAPAKIVVEPSD